MCRNVYSWGGGGALLYIVYNWIYFTWPPRKQAAYKQATRGPTALSPFRGTIIGNEDIKVSCPRALLTLPADSNRGPHD